MNKEIVGSVHRPMVPRVVGEPILRVLVLFMLLMYPLFAGLTDFKTIDAAKEAYEAKAYGKSASLLHDLEMQSPEKEYDLGNALYKDKKYDEALEAYEKSEGVDEATRQHNIGNSYFQKQELDNRFFLQKNNKVVFYDDGIWKEKENKI